MMFGQKKSAGNAMIMILVATAAMSVLFYVVSDKVILQKKQISKTVDLLNLKLGMGSLMDYVLYGIKQKYCFSDDDVLINTDPSLCDLNYDGSVERLLLSPDAISFIRNNSSKFSAASKPKDLNKIGLDKIERYLQISKISAQHPLYFALSNLRKIADPSGNFLSIDGFSVRILKDKSTHLPLAGGEIYLQIIIEMKAQKDGAVIELGSGQLRLVSNVVVYARELGSFALVVPRDLYLNKSHNAALEEGDVSFHQFNSRSEVGKSTGLIFLSPVFVNRDIHFPQGVGSQNKKLSDPPYSAVTFAEKVYLGNGKIKLNNHPFVPLSAGGVEDQFWSQLGTFGGFLKGIEIDGSLDRGLEVLSSGSVDSQVLANKKLMQECIDITSTRATKDKLYKTGSGVIRTSDSINSPTYTLFINKLVNVSDETIRGNSFEPQKNQLHVKDKKWSLQPGSPRPEDHRDENGNLLWANGTLTLGQNSSVGDGIVSVAIKIDEKSQEVQLPASGAFSVTAPVGSKEYGQKLSDDLKSAKRKLEDERNSLRDKSLELNSAQEKLRQLENRPSPPPPCPDPAPPEQECKTWPGPYYDASEVSSARAQVKYISQQVAESEIAVEKAQKTKDELSLVYEAYVSAVKSPPQIDIQTTPIVSIKGFVAPDKVKLSFSFKNGKGFIGEGGAVAHPTVGLLAYDSTYNQSQPINVTDDGGKKIVQPNLNLQGELQFKVNLASGEVEAPTSLIRVDGGEIASTPAAVDYGELKDQCTKLRDAQDSDSFGAADWGLDFTSSSRVSWNFANPTEELEIATDAGFQVRSIIGKCVIKESANLVTGFFNCDHLVIQERSKPLTIIGTFIVGKKLTIAPEAIKAGISWSSIYYPQATVQLRKAGILKSISGKSCDAKDQEPIWHPIPSLQNVADRRSCNVISLREKANPFQWTAVDPDCGLPNTKVASTTQCKHRLIRFFVMEQSRESGI